MLFLSVAALLYFLPTIVAARRGHGIALVLLLNLFFGWTVIVWFALLLWALLAHPYQRYRVQPHHYYFYPPNYYPPNYYPPNR